MKIFVVDDDTEILEMLKIFFESKGHSCVVFATGREMIKEIEHNRPDVIFLDITLYDEDGLVVLHDIKYVDKTITVVMVTAYKSADKVVQAFRDGAMDCLLKPINFDYLENYILAKVGTQIKAQ